MENADRGFKEELKVLYRLPPKLTDPDRYELKRTHDKVQNAAQSHRLPDRYEEEKNEGSGRKILAFTMVRRPYSQATSAFPSETHQSIRDFVQSWGE